jgi:hypothetical protein
MDQQTLQLLKITESLDPAVPPKADIVGRTDATDPVRNDNQ